MKKIFGLLFVGMLCVGMVGCGDDVQEQVEKGYNDATQEEQQAETPKDEVVEPKEVQEPVEEPAPVQEPVKDISNDVDGAYDLVKPLIEEQFASLDHEYTIMNGELMLIGYLPADEVYYGISDGSWDDLIANAEYASTNIKSALDAAGYTNVHFNISMCDNVKRQDLCYLLVRDGATFFNVADEMQ